MVMLAAMRLGLHQGARRTFNPASRASNARLFSSLLTNYRSQAAVVLPRTRYISSTPTPPSNNSEILVDPPVTPDASAIDPEVATSAVDTITNTVIPALQYGDFAALGLASWFTPAGWIRWTFELINVSTGMPWFWTIVAGTALWRLACAPFAIIALRESAKSQPHQEYVKHLYDNIKAAAKTGDKVALQKGNLLLKEYHAKNQLNPMRGALGIVQLPIQLGLFFGVQKMCSQVPQLHDSGVSFLGDLSAADPTYVLPVLFVLSVQLQMWLAARDINNISNPSLGHMMNGFRLMSLVFAPVMMSWPSGLFVSMITTSALTGAQSLVLRMPAVRRALQIPIPPRDSLGKLPSFTETFAYVRNNMRQRVAEEQARNAARGGRLPPRATGEITYELPQKFNKKKRD